MAEVEDSKQAPGQEQQQQEVEENGGVQEAMKPWEQHSVIISIPRFDYNAPSLLQHSHSGFLITCPIKREKSATKEAISILGKYIESSSSDCLGGSDSSEDVKKRKVGQVEGGFAITADSELSKGDSQSFGVTDDSVKQTPSLLLVKVTRSGLVLFTFPKGSSCDPVSIVTDVNQSLESGALERPLYSRRGIEETELKIAKDKISDPNLCVLLDRNKCFSIVAAAVKEPKIAI